MDLFPFEQVRDGQRDFLEDVRDCLEKGESLVAHAPTGIGKTVATLVPAVEWALATGGTVFFVTPRHSQHRIAIETVKLIEERSGEKVTAVDFVGKRWMCPALTKNVSSKDFSAYCRTVREDGICSNYNSTFKKTRPSAALLKLLDGYSTEHVEDFVKTAQHLCPYYALMFVSKNARVIICDYFHIFHESVRKSFLPRMEKSLEGAVLIVDEAHNLGDRVRDLMSESLSDFGLSRALKEAEEYAPYLGRDLKALGRVLKKLGDGMVAKSDFIFAVEEAIGSNYVDFAESLDKTAERVRKRQEKSAIGGLSTFMKGWLGQDHGFLRFVRSRSWKGKKFRELNYKCLDPADECRKVFGKLHSAVLMSGTLLPLEMYAATLGLETARQREYTSPFPHKNRLNLVVPTVTTRYKERSEREYSKLAKHIVAIIEAAPGNSAVFFPSYALQERIGDMVGMDTKKQLFWEDSEMKKPQRAELLERFREARKTGAVLMGVVGGSFAEGVDFYDNLLSSVVVVGLPLETPTLEVKALIDYYDKKFRRGWDFGYIYPAMNRAMQSAGRLIRSGSDRGVVVFLDKRYGWPRYNKCFPNSFSLKETPSPALHVAEFWGT